MLIAEIIDQLKAVKQASYTLALIEQKKRDQLLLDLAANLRQASSQLISANQQDLALMDSTDPTYDRLLLSEERIYAIAADVESVALLPHAYAAMKAEIQRPDGLRIQKVSVPLGVVAVIYESRPNVTVDVFTLCFKTGNACVLKGGKEAQHSNAFLVSLITQTLLDHAIDRRAIYLLPLEPNAINALLKATDIVDVCIPRGGQSLINFVRENARVPVIETGAGVVHTYFDVSGDIDKGRLIIDNAKTRRVSVCNALDTLIIHHQRLTDLPQLLGLLATKAVEIYADELSYHALAPTYTKKLLHQAGPDDFGREFLSNKLAIKTVNSIEAAVTHILRYTSAHSEAIIAEDRQAINYFLKHIDAAVLYVNASTAFTDGGEFGMGAEIGISTQKLHARGPMSLEALTSYKWVVLGDGHIRP